MELEEAIKTLQIIANGSDQPFKFAIKTVLQALEKSQKHCKELIKEKQELSSALLDSIPNKKIEDKIKELNEGIKEDMKNHDKVKDESWKIAIHRSMGQKIEVKKFLQELLEDK